ncbi:MAG TPA: APC family permease [Agromyces sp.]|nr:APC family permease [Agromyces sp.]
MTTQREAPQLEETRGAHRLSTRALGAPAITLMIIAASAPLTVIAGGVPTSFAVTGSMGIPIGYLVLAVMLIVFSVGFAAMGRFITNAGAFYPYIARGLGRPLGVGASFTALVAYNTMQIGIYGLFGFQLADVINQKFGIETPWWLWVLLCIAVVGVLGVNRVDLSAKVLGALVLLEFAVVIIFDVVALSVAPEGANMVTLNPSVITDPVFGIVLLFNFAAFMGFEGAAIYSEEAKDPKRTVPRATYAAVAIIGLFYAFSAWAFSIGIGPSNIVDASREAGPGLMFAFMGENVGIIVADLMMVLFLTSLFAALQSFHNAVARYFFSMGREGVLPRAFSRTNRAGAPVAGSIAQSTIAVLVVMGFALAGGLLGGDAELGPLFPVFTMFTWLTNTGAMGLVLLMLLSALAVIGFFRRNHHGLNVWTRIIAPTISALFLLWVLFMVLTNFQLMLGQAVPDASTFVLPGLIFAGMLGGLIWGLVLKSRDPALYRNIGHGADGPEDVDADADAGSSR